MNHITIELFNDSPEIISIRKREGGYLVFTFENLHSGILSIGGYSVKIIAGECKIPVSNLMTEEFTPILTIEEKKLALPRLKRVEKRVFVLANDEKVANLALHEAELRARVLELEDEIENIRKSINDYTIF